METTSHARWIAAKTYPDAPHEYVLRRKEPAVFEHYQRLIHSHGVLEKFTLRGQTATYRYYYEGAFKYWIIGTVLNRAKV